MLLSGWLLAWNSRLRTTFRQPFSTSRGRHAQSRQRTPQFAAIESLEDRTLLSTITVNSFHDSIDANPGDGTAADASGSTTLRAAVMEANALFGNDTINLPAGTYRLGVTGIDENFAYTGDLDVTDTSGSLTIFGAGAGTTFIDAATIDRVFDVFAGATLHLVGVTVTGGRVSAAGVEGGGIYNQGTLTLTSSVVTGNAATGQNASGGGILNTINGTAIITDTTINANVANNGGGGIGNRGAVTINGGTIASNEAYDGGGIALASGSSLRITNGTITSNTATHNGAGIANFYGAVNITGTTLSNNTASNFAGAIYQEGTTAVTTISEATLSSNTAQVDGGAFYNVSGQMTVIDSSVTGNSALNGGAFSNSGGGLNITGTTVASNTAQTLGGGVSNFNGGSVTIVDSTLTSNAADYGGGLWTDGTAKVTRTTFLQNTAEFDSGGLFNQGSLTVDASAFLENSASYGGAMSNGGSFAVAGIQNSTFAANVATNYGGAISNFQAGILLLTNNTISTNSADIGGGVWSDSDIGAGNNLFAGNLASSHSPDLSGSFLADSFVNNLIGDIGNATGVVHGTNGNIVGGGSAAVIDPLLGPLSDNGGTTKSFALLPNSYAVDAGNNTGALTTDQRGLPRVIDGNFDGTVTIDIGAYELQRQPTAKSPITLTIDNTPTFEWTAITGVTHYDLWVNDLTTGQSGVIRNQAVTGTQYTATTQLVVGHEYLWTVRGIESDDTAGNWAEHVKFTVKSPTDVPAPTLTAMAAGNLDATPTFQWTATSGAARYEIWVNDLTTGQSGVIRSSDITTNTFTPGTELAGGHQYIWTIRAINDAGIAGNWATHKTFTVTAAPTIQSPTGATSVRTPTFQWTAVTGAVRYDIWVNDLTTGQSGVIRKTDVTTTTYTPTIELIGGHQYLWTVRAIDAQGEAGLWATHHSFALPATLLSPTTGSIDTTPTFKWTAVDGAATYQLWVNDLTAGQSKVIYNASVADNTYTSTNELVVGHSYIWTVRSVSSNGSFGEWSTHATFTIETLASVSPPTLTSLPTSTDTTPTLTWTEITGAAKYDLWVNDLTTGQSGVIRTSNITSSSYTPTTLLQPGHSYLWTVRAIGESGQTGTWGTHQQFTIGVLGVATIEAPGANTSSATPTFQWSTVTGATAYDIWVNDLTTGQSSVIRNTNVTTNTLTPTTPLSAGHSYQWTVRALNADGVAGDWAAAKIFQISTLGAPQLQGPSGTATTAKPTFTWTAVDGAAVYDLWVNDLTTGQSAVIRNKTVSGTTFTPTTPLVEGHSYLWTVRGISGDGTPGEWQSARSFTILAAPQLLTVSGSITQARPAFEWTAVAGAAVYDIWVNDLTTGQSGIIRNQTVSGTTFTPSNGLVAGHNYIWTVRAIDSSGNGGAWATHRTFTITTAANDALATGSQLSVPQDDDLEDGVNEDAAETLVADNSEIDAVMADWDATDWWAAANEGNSSDGATGAVVSS